MDCCEKRTWIVRCKSSPCFPSTNMSNITQLFGGSAFTKGYFFGLNDYNKATWFQNFIASIAGASASLLVSAPLDVVKTRIQNRNFENPEGGFKIVSDMMKNEGPSSFFKGLVPKVCFFSSILLCSHYNKILINHSFS